MLRTVPNGVNHSCRSDDNTEARSCFGLAVQSANEEAPPERRVVGPNGPTPNSTDAASIRRGCRDRADYSADMTEPTIAKDFPSKKPPNDALYRSIRRHDIRSNRIE